MKEIKISPRKVSDDFWVIMREDINKPMGACVEQTDCEGEYGGCHKLYDSEKAATTAAESYAKSRRAKGDQYRYYVLKTTVVVGFDVAATLATS